MSGILERRIGWAILWPLCLAMFVANWFYPPSRPGITSTRELLIGVLLLSAATAGLCFRWGPVVLGAVVGAFLAALVLVNGLNVFQHTVLFVSTGVAVGLATELLRKVHSPHGPSI